MSKIRVLIADDHALVREGIAAFLRLCDDIEVVGEASTALRPSSARSRSSRMSSDDISMPKLAA
jgi:DNA-binding NarL/FixJ family response regulator